MPTVTLYPGAPIVDESTPGHAGNDLFSPGTPNLGGLDGGQTFRAWSADLFDDFPPGNDLFRFTIPPAEIPAAAVVSAATMTVTWAAQPLPDGIAVYWDGEVDTFAGWLAAQAAHTRERVDLAILLAPDDGSPRAWPAARLGDFPIPGDDVYNATHLADDDVTFTGTSTFSTQTVTEDLDPQTASQWNGSENTILMSADSVHFGGQESEIDVSEFYITLTYDIPEAPLRIVEAAQDGGRVWRVGPTSNPDGGIMRLVEPDGTVWVQSFDLVSPYRPWTVVNTAGDQVITIPMRRETSVDAGSWTDVGFGYVYDAGLYLGSAFSDADGYPTSLPADADTLELQILQAGQTPDDMGYPAAFAGIDGTGNYYEEHGTLPAGAHLWVVWFGPAFDTSIDPAPSVADPATLASSSLAENGTG